MRYINYNGNIYPEHEALLPVTNRAFRYGDGFFESMVMFKKRIPLLEYHWARVAFTTDVISATLPAAFDVSALESMILDLASVNDALQNARVRVQFFRKGKGLYLPEDDELGFSITMDKLEKDRFEMGSGLTIGVRDDAYKGLSMVSDLKNSGALMYVLAAQFARSEGWDECVLTNHFGQVCEGLNSNIFIVQGEQLITPTLESGCVNGVMRGYILGLMEGKVIERDMEVEELFEVDEIFFTNAVKGVQWVKELQGKTYRNEQAKKLTDLLNQSLVGKPS